MSLCTSAPGEQGPPVYRRNSCGNGYLMCPRCSETDGVGAGYYRDGSGRVGWLCPRCGDFPMVSDDNNCVAVASENCYDCQGVSP